MIAEEIKSLIESSEETYYQPSEAYIGKVIYLEEEHQVIFIFHRPLYEYMKEQHYAGEFAQDKVSTYCFFDTRDAAYEVVTIDDNATIQTKLIDEDAITDGWLRYLVVCKGVELHRFTSHRDETPLPAYLEIINLEHI